MKYYVIEIAEGADAIKGFAIYEKPTEKEAVALFHQKLSTAMKSDLYTSDLLMVIDEAGKVLKRERYVA